MPPLVAAAAITGIGGAVTSVIGAKSASGAQKRATAAQERAAAKAEAFEREQDAKEQAEHARLEAEDRRRWDVEQQNLASERAERDARQAYEDKLRYRKMVNLARLTGGPTPEAPPVFGAPTDGSYTPMASTYAVPGAPILSQPSRANAMIAQPGAFDPFTDAPGPMGMPLSALNRRRTV